MEIPAEKKVHILIHCPQCRGDIDFLEEARVIRCQFCNSSLLVAGRAGVLRYVMPPQILDRQMAQSVAEEHLHVSPQGALQMLETFLFYVPFWRMQGMVYRWVFGRKVMKGGTLFPTPDPDAEIKLPPIKEREKVLLTRVLDHTIPGYTGLEMGLTTLGVRGRALRLQVFDREHLEKRDSFFPLQVSLEYVRAEAERFGDLFFPTEGMEPEFILHRMVGRIFSVIYFPVWWVECQHGEARKTLLIDGVGKRVLGGTSGKSSLLEKLHGEETRKPYEFSEIRFLPFRCPNCGWNFPFRPLSVLHFCLTCRRLWREKNGQWVEVKYQTVRPPSTRAQDLLWVPFFRFRAVVESGGERMETMADLYRMAPPPRAVNQEREARRPIYFYITAVKFRNPQTFLTLASRLTFLQPHLELDSFPDGSHPFTAGGNLLEEDALELGPVILGSLIPPKSRKARDWIKNCRVDLQDPQVLYFPFTRADLFWKEMTTGISFQHNALCEDLPDSA